jgi:hypothetical protein
MKHTSKSVGSVAADGEGTQAGSQVAEMTAQTSAAPPNPPPPPLELLPIRRRHSRLPLLSLPVCAGAAADAPRRAVRWLFVTSRTPRVQAAPCSGPTRAWPRRRRSQTRFGPRCDGRTVCDAEPNDAEPMGPFTAAVGWNGLPRGSHRAGGRTSSTVLPSPTQVFSLHWSLLQSGMRNYKGGYHQYVQCIMVAGQQGLSPTE